MAKNRNRLEYGDFQTPPELALAVCNHLKSMSIDPDNVIEPTCGRGAFLEAALETFPAIKSIVGVEINPKYAREAKDKIQHFEAENISVNQGDFFQIEWDRFLALSMGNLLILGNPPWVTNSELGSIGSTNLPTKTNFQGHRGLDALTGKANFDISEWMLLQHVEWLEKRQGWLAMLVKTTVARKVLRQIWKAGKHVGKATIIKIDAMQHFDAAVDACLFILPFGGKEISLDCDVFEAFDACTPSTTIGYHSGHLVSDIDAYINHQDIIGHDHDRTWRSGVKHDCSRIMELSRTASGILKNGLQEVVEIENDFVFPMLKSSDVAKGRLHNNKYMIVTQQNIGEQTSGIATIAPATWAYLTTHGEYLDKRGSAIYRDKPRFSIFGIGKYTFSPWKIAISGFYKSIHFLKVGPFEGKPVVFDDTVYFLPCQSEQEADLILQLLESNQYRNLINSMVFTDAKRPITVDILKRISLKKVASKIGLQDSYASLSEASQGEFVLTMPSAH